MTERNEHHTFKADEEISDPAVLSKTPLVSVNMITYNHEPYIAQAIEGVLMQKTNFPYEVLIGEDDSSDGTREICKEYAAKHPDKIRLFLNDRKNVIYINGRPTGRWNFINLLKNSKAEYIALCEGDDYWTDPLKLQKQVEFLEANPNYGMVHSDIHVLYQRTNKLKKNYKKTNKVYVPTGYIFEDYLIHSFISTCSVCFKRSFLTDEIIDILLNKNFQMGDRIIFLEISKKAKVGYIEESLATRRILDESATYSKNNQKGLQNYQSRYAVKQFFIEKYGCSLHTKKQLVFYYNKGLLQHAFLLNDNRLGDKAFNAARRNINNGLKINTIEYFYYLGTKKKSILFLGRPILP